MTDNSGVKCFIQSPNVLQTQETRAFALHTIKVVGNYSLVTMFGVKKAGCLCFETGRKKVLSNMFYEFFLALDTDCFTEIISLEPFYSPYSMATNKSCNHCETHVLYFVIQLFLLAA